MSVKDEQREWLRAKIAQHGRGIRVRLAEYLGFDRPDPITRMLNVKDGKEARAIKADEWTKIVRFFETVEAGGTPTEALPSSAAPGSIEQRYRKLPEEFRLTFEEQLSALERLAAAKRVQDPPATDDPE